jgi:hypothetical protein
MFGSERGTVQREWSRRALAAGLLLPFFSGRYRLAGERHRPRRASQDRNRRAGRVRPRQADRQRGGPRRFARNPAQRGPDRRRRAGRDGREGLAKRARDLGKSGVPVPTEQLARAKKLADAEARLAAVTALWTTYCNTLGRRTPLEGFTQATAAGVDASPTPSPTALPALDAPPARLHLDR